MSSPRSYFAALADASRIIALFGDDFELLHRMPDAYYCALTACRSTKQALALKLYLDTEDLLQLADADCRTALVEIDMPLKAPKHAELESAVVLAIEDGEDDDGFTLKTDAERDVARRVLLNLPLSRKGKTREPVILELPTAHAFIDDYGFEEDHMTEVKILFDGWSHESGMPRAWAACRNRAHKRCYRYLFPHRFPVRRELYKQLAGWVMLGMRPDMGTSPITHLCFRIHTPPHILS